MARIGLLSPGWYVTLTGPDPSCPDGGGYYRLALPGRVLSSAGHHVVHSPYYLYNARTGEIAMRDFDGTLHDHLDVIVMQRTMQAHHADMISRARSYGQVIVQDVDDWFFGLDTRNAAFQNTHKKASPKQNIDLYRKALAASSALWVSTPYLAKRLEVLGRPTFVLRNAIDLDRWPVPRVRERWEIHLDDKPTIGWVGGTPWRSGDLETLQGVLGPFITRHNLHFEHAGQPQFAQLDAAPRALGVPLHRATVRTDVSIRDYPSLFRRIDIGIVPLRDCPFSYAKSAIKGMEYAAAGIPFVASASPEYQWLATHGPGYRSLGRVAYNPKDWLRHLADLLDPHQREIDATVNREALKLVSLDAVGHQWLDALDQLLPSPTPVS